MVIILPRKMIILDGKILKESMVRKDDCETAAYEIPQRNAVLDEKALY